MTGRPCGGELADLGRLVAHQADEPIGVERLMIYSRHLARIGPIYEPLGHADLGRS